MTRIPVRFSLVTFELIGQGLHPAESGMRVGYYEYQQSEDYENGYAGQRGPLPVRAGDLGQRDADGDRRSYDHRKAARHEHLDLRDVVSRPGDE